MKLKTKVWTAAFAATMVSFVLAMGGAERSFAEQRLAQRQLSYR